MTKLLDLPVWVEQRRQYSLFSDFTGQPPRQTHTYTLADINADADLAEVGIFSPGRRVYVHGVTITPLGSSAGIDDSNTSVWTVKDDGGNTMVTKTYNTTITHPAANTQESLGTVAYNVIEAAGLVTLTVTNGTNANTVATLVTLTYSDYNAFPSGDWNVVATDDGSASVTSGVDGSLALTPSDGTAGNNDEVYLVSAAPLFKMLNNQPILVETRLQFTEANTDDANVAFGLSSSVSANCIVDDGAGLLTNFNGAAIYKVDGGTVWKCVSSISTTQTISTSTTTAGGASDQILRLEFQPVAGSICEVSFFVNDKQLIDSTTLRPIKHRVDYTTSPLTMYLFAGVKNGGTNAETLNLRYAGGAQLRP